MVTGAAGFLGWHLSRRLRREGHDLVLLDNFCVRPMMPPAGEVAMKDVCELTRRDLDGVDVVYHLAALRNVPESHRDPQRYQSNVTVGRHLVRLVAGSGVKTFVLASSCEVYGQGDRIPTIEAAPLLPQSPYASAKASLELHTRSTLIGRPTVVIARLFNVYGPGNRADTVIASFCRSVAHGSPLTVDGDGSQRRDFSFVDDTVHKLTMLMSIEEPAVVNIGSGHSVSVRELVDLLSARFPQTTTIRQPPRPNEIAEFRAETSNAEQLLGRHRGVDLDEGISRTLRWWQSRAGAVPTERES